MPRSSTRAIAAAAACALAATGIVTVGTSADAAVTSSEFTVTQQDLAFILKQIQISEAHATTEAVNAGGTPLLGQVVAPTSVIGPGVNDVANATLPYGLRQLDGRNNNIASGTSTWDGRRYTVTAGGSALGATDTLFPRLTTPVFPYGTPTAGSDSPSTSDDQPRIISDLIADMTPKATSGPHVGELFNPVAMEVSGQSTPVAGSGGLGYGSVEILNTAPGGTVLPPYSSMFSFFGQFFDHGLDLVGKSGTSFVTLPAPANSGDVLAGQRAMRLNRTVYPAGSNVALTAGTNYTTPWIDQNQTYGSHPSKQVFIREYVMTNGKPVATGALLSATAHAARAASGLDPAEPAVNPTSGNIGTWRDVKEQAREMLGIKLVDSDISNVPLLLTDEYGRFLRGPNGFAQLVTTTDLGGCAAAAGPVYICEGNPASPITTTGAVRTGHAFLNDINPYAEPHPSQTPDTDLVAGAPDNTFQTYDNELLDAHYITGDGRGNENIGLTAVHTVFHAEHDRLLADITSIVDSTPSLATGFNAAGLWSRGDRLFQAAKLVNEMEYQHLVFDTFARRIDPGIKAFVAYNPALDPSITAEFANAVYRFGHSMLNESIARTAADGTDLSVSLFDGFLNPLAFNSPNGLSLTGGQAAGSVARGSSLQVGNEIDEFVTGALRNNLVGAPLDLAALNLARGRDTGMPPLNEVRRQLYARTLDPGLLPYTSWNDFGTRLRHPASLVNFVAAYGSHQSIADQATMQGKRCAAYALVNGALAPSSWGCPDGLSVPGDAATFMAAAPAAGRDVNAVDLWMGGLAETRGSLGPSMLGTTFSYVFRTQLESLQEGDRFYYLGRLAGTNLLNQVANNTLADMFVRNTDATSLPADMFSAPGIVVDMAHLPSLPYTYAGGKGTLSNTGNGVVTYTGTQHTVFVGRDAVDDKMRSGSRDDTLRGFSGNDWMDGDDGSDNLQGGTGNDVMIDTGLSGADIALGGSGDDYMSTGTGADVNDGGLGNDTAQAGPVGTTANMGGGNDLGRGSTGPDSLTGDEGDDWFEGGDGADLLAGDLVLPPLGIDVVTPGRDVLIGGGGTDSFNGGGAMDVLGGGDAAATQTPDLMVGGQGFDWATYTTDVWNRTPGLAVFKGFDEDLALTAPAPGDPRQAVMDLFADGDVEGIAGGPGNDVLAGDARAAFFSPQGADDRLTAADTATVTGLAALLVPGVADGTTGNILLGGAGSDSLNGRGGDDVIDGDATLTVSLAGCGQSTLAGIVTAVSDGTLTGACTAGSTTATRAITLGSGGTDTVVYAGTRAQYTVTLVGTGAAAYYRVTGPEGTDVVRNVEAWSFSDGTITTANILTPVSAPSVPLNVRAVGANRSAVVTWDAPTTTGGGTTTYTVSAWSALTKGKKIASCSTTTALTCSITALTNGTAYYLDMTASNARGTSAATSPRVQVIPQNVTAPTAPTGVAVTPGNTNAAVSWVAPSSTGGTGITITSYQARAFSSAGVQVASCTTSGLSCTIPGLTNGVSYGIDVVATSSALLTSAASSPRVTVVPSADPTPPSAPQAVKAAAGDRLATVSWTAPATSGDGGPISTYTATAYDASSGGTAIASCTTSTLSCPITSLSNGVTYYVDVTATNGSTVTGPASTPRVAVTPSAVVVLPTAPSAPLAVKVTGASGSLVVSWSLPASDGGSPITGYEARAYVKNRGGSPVARCTSGAGTLTCTIFLGAGTYYVDVVATNAIGTGAASSPRIQGIAL